MIVERMDGTKYVRAAKMDSKDSYIIKLKNVQEGEIVKVKQRKLKRQ